MLEELVSELLYELLVELSELSGLVSELLYMLPELELEPEPIAPLSLPKLINGVLSLPGNFGRDYRAKT